MADLPSPPTPPPEGERAARLFEEAAGEAPAGPGRPSPPAPAEIAPHFPELEILDVIGAGGMGVVYRARHRRLDRLVALKVLPKDLAQDPQFAERFAREAKTLALLDHPRIVRVHDFGQAQGLYYLVMEHVDGANLRQVMAAGRLAPREALAIVPQICEALQYAHDQGVVHRDIKPENVLLDSRGRVKITDFGLAKIVGKTAGDAVLTSVGQVMGTFQYMAPEQYRAAGDVDHRADLFSLGVVFYEMLTGQLPVGTFAPPSRAADLDARIDHIVLRALEHERARRYQRAEEIRTDVTGLSSPASAQVRAPARADEALAPTRPGGSPGAGRRALVLSALALPLALVAFALVHEAWGGVIRGTDDAAAREIWKGVAGGAFCLLGAAAGIVSAVRGAAAARRGFVHKAGMTLALLHVAGLVALLIVVGLEVATHARTSTGRRLDSAEGDVLPPVTGPDTGRDPRAVARGVDEAWARFGRTWDRGATWETVADEYAPADRSRLLAIPAAERAHPPGGLGVGPPTLRWEAPPSDHLITGVERTSDPDRVFVSIRHREAPPVRDLRFPMTFAGGRWNLAIGPVEVVLLTGPR
jgi:hypothetical protein